MSEALYDIAERYREVMEIEGDDPDTIAARQAALDEIAEALDVKAESIIRFVRNLEANADAIKAEEKRLADRRRAMENKGEWLRGYLSDSMRRMGMTSVKAGIFEAKFKLNPPSVKIVNPDFIPSIFYIPQEPKLSLSAIKDAIKAGQVVPGAELQQGESLLIR